jgi:hypothetical protein
VPTTPDTSGHTYQPELLQCDQVSVSLKTSKDISRWGCPTSSKTWQDWVTEQRGAYSQRLKSAQSISASGSSFWPSVVASEVRQGFQDRSRGKKGSQESLTTVVVKHATNWSTPNCTDGKTGSTTTQGRSLVADIQLHGQAARASSNTNGNRQELWLTPKANESDSDPNFAARNADRGLHCHGTLSSQAKSEMWLTPNVPNGGRVNPPEMSPTGTMPDGSKRQVGLENQAKQWATPQARGGQATRTTKVGGLRKLEDQTEAKATGKLNPRWVETLMGLPVGWVMPSCASPVTIEPTNSDSSATELSPPPPNELFEFCLQS